MPAADSNSRMRVIGDSLGVVHRRFADHDPPVVGTQVVSADWEKGVEVRFLLPTEQDVARAAEHELLRQLQQAYADALRHSASAASSLGPIRVSVSSLEAQGIRRSRY
jgi:hypothetical protein